MRPPKLYITNFSINFWGIGAIVYQSGQNCVVFMSNYSDLCQTMETGYGSCIEILQ